MMQHLIMAFSKTSPLFSLFRKTPSIFLPYINPNRLNSLKPITTHAKSHPSNPFSMKKLVNLSTASSAAILQNPPSISSCSSASSTTPQKSRKKARRESPDSVLRHKLDQCSKRGDLGEALRIYDEARANGIPLNVHHYNVLLYLCSARSNSSEEDIISLEKGFQIFKQMGLDNVVPNEATFTSAARLAAAKEDPDMAFDLVKNMKSCGIVPKLRSYGPALFGFCKKLVADKAFEVDAHMVENSVLADEEELLSLLRLSSETRMAEKVYEMMHRMRATVRQVSEETAGVIEDWFKSECAAEVGFESWDEEKVKEGIVKRGGGWHGQGWLGKGKWCVVRTEMEANGVCRSCGEKLVCIDLDPKETQNFADSVAKLACEREVRADFVKFQEWLEKHGPFEAIVDGANLGLTDRTHFSFQQLKHAVHQLRQMSKSNRLPLVILHRSRVSGGPAQYPANKKLLDSWRNAGALYATPHGSNDDWYWIYAAVRCKCLLVTNDEMRDHLFQLLGTSFFPRWKEKHQVRFTPSRTGLNVRMPPPYSIVIQESEQGSWHVPTVTGDDLGTPRKWVCATRTRKN